MTSGSSSLARDWIELLCSEIGPRRPTGDAERAAAERMRAELAERGVDARLEAFDGYSSFAASYGLIFGLALAPTLLPRRRRLLRAALAACGAGLGAAEGGLIHTPLSRALSRSRSQNLVAAIEPREETRRTLCLVSHLDTSRSGLMFHPRVVGRLGGMVGLVGASLTVQAAEPLLARTRIGTSLLGLSRAIVAVALALVVERELRGLDVAGANDNATGVAVTCVLAAECAAQPLHSTRVVLLSTGCEESGVLGAQAFLDVHETDDWLFLNFDGVGAPASLHFLRREGGTLRSWRPDDRLVAIAEEVARRRPELELTGTRRSSGLPYDSTPMLARGRRALTLTVQNGSIPNYHWPTDTPDNLDRGVLERAIETGRELIAAVERGDADG